MWHRLVDASSRIFEPLKFSNHNKMCYVTLVNGDAPPLSSAIHMHTFYVISFDIDVDSASAYVHEFILKCGRNGKV